MDSRLRHLASLVGLAETMLIVETTLVSLIPDLGLSGVKCSGPGLLSSELIILRRLRSPEKCGEKYFPDNSLLPSCLASSGNVSHLCYIFPLMPNNKRLLELALKGLQSERSRIDEEITELTSLRMQGVRNEGTPRNTRTGAVGDSVTGPDFTGSKPKRKRNTTAAGRKRLSEAAKRRWAANRKT